MPGAARAGGDHAVLARASFADPGDGARTTLFATGRDADHAVELEIFTDEDRQGAGADSDELGVSTDHQRADGENADRGSRRIRSTGLIQIAEKDPVAHATSRGSHLGTGLIEDLSLIGEERKAPLPDVVGRERGGAHAKPGRIDGRERGNERAAARGRTVRAAEGARHGDEGGPLGIAALDRGALAVIGRTLGIAEARRPGVAGGGSVGARAAAVGGNRCHAPAPHEKQAKKESTHVTMIPHGVRALTRPPAVGTVLAVELRTFTYLDVLQPQLTSFLQTVSQGFMPLEGQASLFLEIAPGIAINQLTDAALKRTRCQPGMQIVERAYGLLELHHDDQGEIRSAGEAILERLGARVEDRLKPRVVSAQTITGLDGHQAQLINRMRHGDMISQGQTLYILEVHPAGYAAIAANEAEKAAPIHLLEVITFGAFGRLWLGGYEAEIAEAARAIEATLASISGRENRGD